MLLGLGRNCASTGRHGQQEEHETVRWPRRSRYGAGQPEPYRVTHAHAHAHELPDDSALVKVAYRAMRITTVPCLCCGGWVFFYCKRLLVSHGLKFW